MKLSDEHWAIRFAFWPERLMKLPVPSKTSLCAVFWRCTVVAPLFLGAVGLGAAVFYAICGVFFITSRPFVYILKKYPKIERFATTPIEDTIIGAWVSDFMNKTCTVIEIANNEFTLNGKLVRTNRLYLGYNGLVALSGKTGQPDVVYYYKFSGVEGTLSPTDICDVHITPDLVVTVMHTGNA